MSETGSVKFVCQQVEVKLPRFAAFAELNKWREELLSLGLIGANPSGIGFGNLSVRDGTTSQFYITGSGTGGIPVLEPSDYAKVVRYDFTRNWLQCEGLTVASSESLTHAAVYESDPRVRAVIHCHDMKLWVALLDKAPTTPRRIEYGTPEMAWAVQRLFDVTDVKMRKVFVMAAHEGGMVTFGKDLGEAFFVLRNADCGSRAGERQRME